MVAAARLVQRACRRGLDAMTLDAMLLLRPIDEKARAIRAFDGAVARQVEIDLGVAERAAAAIARGDHAVDIDRLERLHLFNSQGHPRAGPGRQADAPRDCRMPGGGPADRAG